MAYDLTTTKNRAIVIGGILAAVTLASLHFVFDSYFTQVTEAVQHDKLVSPEQLIDTRTAERKALADGPVTIEAAMAQLSRQGRGANGGVDIAAKQSADQASLVGWNKMPRQAEPFAGMNAADAGVADGGAPASLATDGGSALATGPREDGGAAPSTESDAGTKYTPQR